jgi:hypothetical protein
MDRAWMYDLARIDPMYIENVHHFVEEAMRHANREKKSDIFYPCVDCDNKIAWPDSKVVKSHLIKRGFKKSYIIWTAHDEIDNALLEVDRGEVRDDDSHYQDGGVFDGADHGIDDFNYEELLHHVEPQVLNSMGTDRGLDNMEILKHHKSILSHNPCHCVIYMMTVTNKWLLISESHGDSNRCTPCRGKSDQHATRFPCSIRIWSKIIRISRGPHIAIFCTVVNRFERVHCPREEGSRRNPQHAG